MTSAIARYRYVLGVVILMVATGCRPHAGSEPVPVVNLLHELDRAEKRPPDGFALASHTTGGRARPSLAAPVPSRVTWALPLPRHGVFRAFLAVGGVARTPTAVRFRIGVSDHRIYEAIAARTVQAGRPGWLELASDLSAYAGFKWSLFYPPDRITWHVVLAADPVDGGPALAVWGSPEIITDHRSAREYITRRRQLRHES